LLLLFFSFCQPPRGSLSLFLSKTIISQSAKKQNKRWPLFFSLLVASSGRSGEHGLLLFFGFGWDREKEREEES
jgi:hypothetical protein